VHTAPKPPVTQKKDTKSSAVTAAQPVTPQKRLVVEAPRLEHMVDIAMKAVQNLKDRKELPEPKVYRPTYGPVLKRPKVKGSSVLAGKGKAPLTVPIRLGELCVRPVETLLISRRVNAGKCCYCMTLLSYLLPVKWRKYQYAKLINEFLANFLLYLPYRKCCLTLSAAAAEAATGVCDVDKMVPVGG